MVQDGLDLRRIGSEARDAERAADEPGGPACDARGDQQG
jgi:hypothetical protein